MDLSTNYLGLKLRNPIVVASSPLSRDLDRAKRLEEAGAAAIVMYSLFEEQINHEQGELDHFLAASADSYAEALSYFPEPSAYLNLHAEDYLDHLRRLKGALKIPVIGSLNGVSPGGWIRYAREMQNAGADAIELNVYYMATRPDLTSERIEQMYLDNLKAVKEAVTIPVAIKVGPYFTAFANFAQKLDRAGANGLVLFNRFFGPDIDLENLEVVPQLMFSTPFEMRLPLRWIAVLHGNVRASLAATTGVRNYTDVIKMVMAGADVTMPACVLLEKGVEYLGSVVNDMKRWMEEHNYESVQQMKGSMSYKSVKEPAAYERANYMKTLQSYE